MSDQDSAGDSMSPLPPGLLLRSFLLVASAYVVNIMIIAGIGFVLLWTMFPDSFELFSRDPDEFNQIFEQDPERVYPRELLWMLLAVSVVVSFWTGYFVARMAPIARLPHSVFFAVILFVQYLQLAITASSSMQTMLVLFMAASPVAALLGAQWFLRRAE